MELINVLWIIIIKNDYKVSNLEIDDESGSQKKLLLTIPMILAHQI